MPDLRPMTRHSGYHGGLLARAAMPLAVLFIAAFAMTFAGQTACADPGIVSFPPVLPAQAGSAAADPPTVQAIHGIINDQMAAFRRDDAIAAFNDASPFIQGRFQRPDIFLEMVKSGYAPVYRPQQVEFRDLVQTGDGLDQRVFVLGPDGRAYLAHYLMQRQPDGAWKINGCVLEMLDDRST
jgi:hypothetical protein